MQFSDLKSQIRGRIAATRVARCGGPGWIAPPLAWAEIVQSSWPDIWTQPPNPGPRMLPDGWCDLAMAFSQHAREAAGITRYHEALENLVTGQLAIRQLYDGDYSYSLNMLVHGYRSATSVICRVCGEPGDLRQYSKDKPTRVLCDRHAEEYA